MMPIALLSELPFHLGVGTTLGEAESDHRAHQQVPETGWHPCLASLIYSHRAPLQPIRRE
jgi:hypothetical protein